MLLKPLGDRVLLEPVKEKEEKKGGIIIPDTAKEKPQEGIIIAVGPGKLTDTGDRISMNVQKKDRVLYGKYSGTEVKINGKEYLIMHEDDIFGII